MLKVPLFFFGPFVVVWLQAAPYGGLYSEVQSSEASVVGGGRLDLFAQQNNQARITVTGERMSKGNAVDCPTIRTDGGKTYSISYLSPAIAIGDRITVTGVMANSATCRGPVIRVETVVQH